MWQTIRSWLGSLAILLIVSACTHLAPATEVPSLVLASEPSVVIGSTDGAEPDLLSGVTDAARLGSGTIVVANCGSSEVRYFDREGRHVRTAGGSGEGPGEFRGRMRSLFPAGGDTVGVVDDVVAASVVHFFDDEGDFVRSQQLFSGAMARGRLHDGSLVALRWDNRARLSHGRRT